MLTLMLHELGDAAQPESTGRNFKKQFQHDVAIFLFSMSQIGRSGHVTPQQLQDLCLHDITVLGGDIHEKTSVILIYIYIYST